MKSLEKETIRYFFLKEENAVRRVYEKTYRLLFHIAFSYVNIKEDAEDIVSESYKKALTGTFETLNSHKKFVSYLCAICKNCAIDFAKRKFRKIEINIDEIDISTTDEYETNLIDEIKKILTKEQYDVFIYRSYFELSFKEISSLVNKDESSCRKIFFESRKLLKSKKELWR